jgi:hypothetical protein
VRKIQKNILAKVIFLAAALVFAGFAVMRFNSTHSRNTTKNTTEEIEIKEKQYLLAVRCQ